MLHVINMRTAMSKPFSDVIECWITDLLNPPKRFPLINMNFECVKARRSKPPVWYYYGDPGLFLLARYDFDENLTVEQALGDRRTYDIIHLYTNIPRDKAYELINPNGLFKIDYPVEDITGAQFVEVLRNYLKSGVVDWFIILTEDDHAKYMAAAPKPSLKNAA